MSQRIDLIEVILPNQKPLMAEQLSEALVEGAEPQKFYYLTGLFLEGETQNQNGRVYPRNEIAAAVDKLNQTIQKANLYRYFDCSSLSKSGKIR